MANIPDSSYERDVVGWVKEALREGDEFLRAQRGYTRITDAVDAIMGDRPDIRHSSLSGTTSNHAGKISEDLASSLTDIKPFWEYKTSNKLYEQQAQNFGDLSLHWWLAGGTADKGADLRFKNVIDYALAGGTGYANLEYNEKWQDIVLEAEDPRDMIPIRPASFDTIQDAVGVIIRRERTVNFVRDMPVAKGKEELIVATRDGSQRDALSSTRAGKIIDWLSSPFRQRLFSGNTAAREIPRIPVLDLYTVYLDDNRRHESVTPRYMGPWDKDAAGNPVPLTNWSYRVEKGQLLYPNKRLIILTDTVVLYDGPSPYWHALFPTPKLTLINYPWTWLGKGAMWDILPLQKTLDRMLRVLDDLAEKVARPDIIADKNSISRAMLSQIDTRRAGGKYMTNPLAGKGFALQYPQLQGLELIFRMVEFCVNEMDALSGVRDISQVMRLNQLPGADTIEKIMESMTASVRLRSRVIENFLREFAQMLAYNFSQFYTAPMRLAMLGEKGITLQDFDFDPGTLIPDYVHSEDVDPLTGTPRMEALERGPRPRYDRAKLFMQQFTYHIAPGSLLASSEIERKLMYLQLARAGIIDNVTLLEVLAVPNIGAPADLPSGIIPRLQWQAQQGFGMTVGPTGASAAGRKATAQTPPRMVIKES